MSKLTDWLSTEERRVEFAEETLIVEVAEQIWAAMASTKATKSEIADRLGKSKAFISQMLNGSRNMTLRSLADIAHCLGYKVHISLKPEKSVDAWQPATVLQFNQQFINAAPVNDLNTGNWTALNIRAA